MEKIIYMIVVQSQQYVVGRCINQTPNLDHMYQSQTPTHSPPNIPNTPVITQRQSRRQTFPLLVLAAL
jgi:hypothetical protein